MSRRAPTLLIVLLVLIVAVGLTVWSCSNGVASPISGDRAYGHAAKIIAFGERPSGHPNLILTEKYINEQLRELGLKPQRNTHFNQKEKLRFSNIWVQIDGEDPENGPILVIGSHYDTKLCRGHTEPSQNFEFVGAVDGGGSSGLLLELARVLKDRKNLPNIWLVWFDGEESLDFKWNLDRALFGSRYFVKTMVNDKKRFQDGLYKRMKVMVLLDLVGAKDYKIDKDDASNPDLVRIFKEAADKLGEGHRMYQWVSTMTDDHKPFIAQQVKCIDLIDLINRGPDENGNAPHPDYAAWWHTEHDTIDKLSAEGLQFAGDLVWVALPMIEKRFYAR